MAIEQHPRQDEPWFRRRPSLTVGVSGITFMAVLALRLATPNAADTVLALLGFPISLLAVTFGTRAGLGAGLLGAASVGVWGALADVNLSWLGWLSRIGPLILFGVALGDASDRLRRAAEERRSHALVMLRHRQGLEINDSLLQGMAAAKWALESGRPQVAATFLEDSIRAGQKLVSESLRDEQAYGAVGPNPHSADDAHGPQCAN